MKIAFTTTDRVHINAHFGWAQEIDVYEISETGYKFLKTVTFDEKTKQINSEIPQNQGESQKNQDAESDDKITRKLEALADCTIVYVASIGGVPAAKLIKKGIMPVKAKTEKEEISVILNKLEQTLKGNPPPWLRKALQKDRQAVGEI